MLIAKFSQEQILNTWKSYVQPTCVFHKEHAWTNLPHSLQTLSISQE